MQNRTAISRVRAGCVSIYASWARARLRGLEPPGPTRRPSPTAEPSRSPLTSHAGDCFVSAARESNSRHRFGRPGPNRSDSSAKRAPIGNRTRAPTYQSRVRRPLDARRCNPIRRQGDPAGFGLHRHRDMGRGGWTNRTPYACAIPRGSRGPRCQPSSGTLPVRGSPVNRTRLLGFGDQADPKIATHSWTARESNPPRVACKASLHPSAQPWRRRLVVGSRAALACGLRQGGRSRTCLVSVPGRVDNRYPTPCACLSIFVISWGDRPVTIRHLRVHSAPCRATTPRPPRSRDADSNRIHAGPRVLRTGMAKRDQQVSVPLPDDLRADVWRQAEQQDRSQAWVIRRLVAEAAAQGEAGERALALER